MGQAGDPARLSQLFLVEEFEWVPSAAHPPGFASLSHPLQGGGKMRATLI